jgi:hypothetical protein
MFFSTLYAEKIHTTGSHREVATVQIKLEEKTRSIRFESTGCKIYRNGNKRCEKPNPVTIILIGKEVW